MSRKYVVTGSASGIGAATVEKLRAEGHTVFGADLANADIIANVGGAEGRAELIGRAEALSGGVLDGVIAVAGIGDPSPKTVAVNYFGAVASLEGLRPLLARSPTPRAAVVSSCGALAPVDETLLDLLLGGDEAAALTYAGTMDATPDPNGLPTAFYTTSKRGISRWVRREAGTAAWAGAGIALNAVAPGLIRTPLNAAIIDSEEGLAAIAAKAPAPFNGPAAPPAAIANLLAWLTSEENLFVTGQVVYADGGTDSIFRPEIF
jgi:NAD(P)-dependent dehydrogenase (short-subunit alcohol dehydrogenase family)